MRSGSASSHARIQGHALSNGSRDRRPGGPQHPIEGRRTGGQHTRPDRHVQREVAVTLERRDKQRKERLESFAADPVGGLPQQDERLTHGFIVDRKPRSPAQSHGDRRRIEQADDVLAVIAGDRDEFIEDPEFLFLQASSIPFPNRLQQILPGFCADLSRHGALLGSATVVADFVRQRPPLSNRNGESMRRQI